jgi:thiamine monophosphate kinase
LPAAADLAAAAAVPLTVIGTLTPDEGLFIASADGGRYTALLSGFDHFASRPGGSPA